MHGHERPHTQSSASTLSSSFIVRLMIFVSRGDDETENRIHIELLCRSSSVNKLVVKLSLIKKTDGQGIRTAKFWIFLLGAGFEQDRSPFVRVGI